MRSQIKKVDYVCRQKAETKVLQGQEYYQQISRN